MVDGRTSRQHTRNSVEFVAQCKELNMIFVSTWSLRTDTYREATARFLKSGAQPPEGIKTIRAVALCGRVWRSACSGVQ